ncbi:MAG TPA: hypothetical protein DCO79_01180, partial [Spirochaeta sp.]|nr:hypothetical protein [Spirochaeta sp.]
MHQYWKTNLAMIICLLLLFTAANAAADETAEQALEEPVETVESSILFINSNPINADILIDGEPLLQKTPALLTDISAQRHEISLRKDGFDI